MIVDVELNQISIDFNKNFGLISNSVSKEDLLNALLGNYLGRNGKGSGLGMELFEKWYGNLDKRWDYLLIFKVEEVQSIYNHCQSNGVIGNPRESRDFINTLIDIFNRSLFIVEETQLNELKEVMEKFQNW